MDAISYIKRQPLHTFVKGAVLLTKDDPIDSLFVIRSGHVKVTSISATGIERLLWIAGRYDLVPTEQFFRIRARSRFFYTAISEGSYYKLDKRVFLNQAQDNQQLMSEIARRMVEHYDDVMTRLDAIDATTVAERLLRTLLYLAERLSAQRSVDLYEHGLGLTHRDIAAMISASRETTSLALTRLRTQECIDYSRHHFIVHTDTIRRLLEQS